MKTKKAALKRIKTTKTGKMMHRSQLQNHLKNVKSASRVRRQQEPKVVDGPEKKVMKRLMPYS